MRRILLAILLVLSGLVCSACAEDTGACVLPSAGAETYCQNDFTNGDCIGAPEGIGTFWSDKTCEEVGYPKECPYAPDSYRKSSYDCPD